MWPRTSARTVGVDSGVILPPGMLSLVHEVPRLDTCVAKAAAYTDQVMAMRTFTFKKTGDAAVHVTIDYWRWLRGLFVILLIPGSSLCETRSGKASTNQ